MGVGIHAMPGVFEIDVLRLLFNQCAPINCWRQSVAVQMGGNPGNGNPQRPFPPKQDLSPKIQPGLENDFAEKGFSNQLPTEKERIENPALGQA